MQANSVKNIVILKNLPSNIVEEAIVILKSNKYSKKLQMIEKNNNKESALILYYFLLILNFSWPIVFFNYQNFLLALAILLALNISTVFLIYLFYKIKHSAAYLLLPYFIWIIFALYLNFWIFLHN